MRAWFKIVSQAQWRNFIEVRKVFKDADDVDGYVVFNLRQNRYRLVTIMHYAREREGRLTEGHVYIRSVLTHRQYDNRANWDKGVKR
jgi:mRNA interferase HigB